MPLYYMITAIVITFSVFQVESDEIYSAKEFLHDISFCTARRVVVFVDQSFSGQLPQHAQLALNQIDNVMIVPTTRADDWIPRHWFNGYMRESSRSACLHDYIKVSRSDDAGVVVMRTAVIIL